MAFASDTDRAPLEASKQCSTTKKKEQRTTTPKPPNEVEGDLKKEPTARLPEHPASPPNDMPQPLPQIPQSVLDAWEEWRPLGQSYAVLKLLASFVETYGEEAVLDGIAECSLHEEAIKVPIRFLEQKIPKLIAKKAREAQERMHRDPVYHALAIAKDNGTFESAMERVRDQLPELVFDAKTATPESLIVLIREVEPFPPINK